MRNFLDLSDRTCQEKHMMNSYSMEIILHEEVLAEAVAAKAWGNDLNHYNSAGGGFSWRVVLIQK